jgi:hypothetical protein
MASATVRAACRFRPCRGRRCPLRVGLAPLSDVGSPAFQPPPATSRLDTAAPTRGGGKGSHYCPKSAPRYTRFLDAHANACSPLILSPGDTFAEQRVCLCGGPATVSSRARPHPGGVGGKAHISVRAVSALERGLKHPQRTTVRLLTDALELQPDEAATSKRGPSVQEVWFSWRTRSASAVRRARDDQMSLSSSPSPYEPALDPVRLVMLRVGRGGGYVRSQH